MPVRLNNQGLSRRSLVRMIYFLPKDRPFRPEVVGRMKDATLQMQEHGYGDPTFRIEPDDQGEPLVHRVDGEHMDEDYPERDGAVSEASQAFAGGRGIKLLVIDQTDTQLWRPAEAISIVIDSGK